LRGFEKLGGATMGREVKGLEETIRKGNFERGRGGKKM